MQHKKDCPVYRGSPAITHIELFFDDFQHFHGAGLRADSAGDALGSRAFGLQDHYFHGAGFHALAAADAVLLVDHINAGLGILGNGIMLAGFHALAALNAHVGLCSGALGNNLYAAQVLIKFLIKGFGTSTDTFQAGHALHVFFYRELFHGKTNPFMYFIKMEKLAAIIIYERRKNSND